MNEPVDQRFWVVILAGGVGSRFWPASTPTRPKQLLPLASERPLIVDTFERARKLLPTDRILVITSRHLGSRIQSLLPGLPRENLLIEPEGRGTGPALTWAAVEVERRSPGAVLVSLHSDHFITPEESFRDTILEAVRLAGSRDRLFAIAVPPTRPEIGYGYIAPGSPIEDAHAAFEVERFVEKPDAATAKKYVDQGFLWNSGIFVWKAKSFLEEVESVCSEIAPHLERVSGGEIDGFFEAVETISVDHGVLERSGRVAALRAGFSWDDLGSWTSLERSRGVDPRGNIGVGEVRIVDGDRTIVYAEDGPVVLLGTRDLIVVRSQGMVLVADRSRAADLKQLVESLPEEFRDSAETEV